MAPWLTHLNPPPCFGLRPRAPFAGPFELWVDRIPETDLFATTLHRESDHRIVRRIQSGYATLQRSVGLWDSYLAFSYRVLLRDLAEQRP